MKRRWIIRSLFIGFVVVCIAAWVGSYWSEANFNFQHSRNDAYLILVKGGRIGFGHNHQEDTYSFTGWHFPLYTREPNDWSEWDAWATFHRFGFSIHRDTVGDFATVPLSFPATLSALMLFLVWRKTRPKSVGRAFPVDLANISANSK